LHKNLKIDSGALTLALSHALDLAEPRLANHQERVAFIVWRMGLTGKLQDKKIRNYFVAALYHDIGAFSLKEKRALLNFEFGNVDLHCVRGYNLLKNTFWLTKTAEIVKHHHKSWEWWKKESRDLIDEIVLGAQLICLADYVDRLIDRKTCILQQKKHITDEILSLTGKEFHKYVVDLFIENAKQEDFWLTLRSEWLTRLLLTDGPLRKEEMNIEVLLPVSELFRDAIDFRSRFTATHSAGVAIAASSIGEIMGLSEIDRELLEISGNLHDIGKFAIPDKLLEKKGKLNEIEKEILKSHVFYTFSILNSVKGLEKVTQWAGFHHEKLNGTGYPFHLKEDNIDTGARIVMIADIFTALIEERPYRKKLVKNEVKKILNDMVNRGEIDDKIVKLLLSNYEYVFDKVTEAQKKAIHRFEKQFA